MKYAAWQCRLSIIIDSFQHRLKTFLGSSDRSAVSSTLVDLETVLVTHSNCLIDLVIYLFIY